MDEDVKKIGDPLDSDIEEGATEKNQEKDEDEHPKENIVE